MIVNVVTILDTNSRLLSSAAVGAEPVPSTGVPGLASPGATQQPRCLYCFGSPDLMENCKGKEGRPYFQVCFDTLLLMIPGTRGAADPHSHSATPHVRTDKAATTLGPADPHAPSRVCPTHPMATLSPAAHPPQPTPARPQTLRVNAGRGSPPWRLLPPISPNPANLPPNVKVRVYQSCSGRPRDTGGPARPGWKPISTSQPCVPEHVASIPCARTS